MSTSEQDSILCIGNKYFVITLHTVTVLERKIQLSIVGQASKYTPESTQPIYTMRIYK